jgi:2-methylcitrate dehydratase PrpD
MSIDVHDAVGAVADFIATAKVPADARARAGTAFRDTLGVMLAGAPEPAARIAQAIAADEGHGTCSVIGTGLRTSAGQAALANGAAAHALDYDDMCFVSLAHPSCALVPALLAAGELVHASPVALEDAYVVGFEIECRLGEVMNPRHYDQRGWHCTSSIGTLGAAAAAARVLGLDADATRHALGIAASSACGLKENIGTMVKPLHAGLAARNGLLAAQLAQRGFTASAQALDGPQGYLHAMDSERSTLEPAVASLGSRWEIVETGVTVKLYPSCAATHPPLDALRSLARDEGIAPDDVAAVDVEVDSMTPKLLIHPDPASGLEAKFSMPFCAGAALVFGRVGIDTFEPPTLNDAAVRRVLPRVTLRANPAFDAFPPLSQARVTVRLGDGRVLTRSADGARGYPGRLTTEELESKFTDCAGRSLEAAATARAWALVNDMERLSDVRELTDALSTRERFERAERPERS